VAQVKIVLLANMLTVAMLRVVLKGKTYVLLYAGGIYCLAVRVVRSFVVYERGQ
jgi:hypothetical protein